MQDLFGGIGVQQIGPVQLVPLKQREDVLGGFLIRRRLGREGESVLSNHHQGTVDRV